MTLAFSTQLNGNTTHFVEKIIHGLHFKYIIDTDQAHEISLNYCIDILQPQKLICTCNNFFMPKIHTIRQDIKNKWKPGNKIHFVINNRTKNRYQFAPTIVCTSTQQIIIKYFYNGKTEQFDLPTVLIDGKEKKGKQLLELANNDGFDTVEDFFAYFKTDFTGKIIHWTNFKY